MAYFTPDFIEFFAELREHNTREWFTSQKKRYENQVKKPFEVFVAEMIRRMREINPAIVLEPKEAIFRIHRDTRFSADKTPYKTHMSAIIGEGGRKEFAKPGMYIELTNTYARVYSGVYEPSKEQLEALRYGIMDQTEAFNQLIADPQFVQFFETIRGERNKILPKPFKEAAAEQPYLFNKQFYFYSEMPASIILQENFSDELIKRYKVGQPLGDFLYKAILEN